MAVEERYMKAVENLIRGNQGDVQECHEIMLCDPEHAEAAALLGLQLVHRNVTEEDTSRGIELLTMAAQKGSAQAATMLGCDKTSKQRCRVP